LLASDTINAFACPGGLIFITKGMLDSIQNEDELAAVLAHEVAHISHGDGISSIKKSRWVEAVQVIGSKAAEEYGSRELSTLVRVFEGSIEDVFKTLVVNGYGRKQELKADSSALIYLDSAGYYPHALTDFVERVLQNENSSKRGLLKTHPGAAERRKNILASLLKRETKNVINIKRSKRFKRLYTL
jgi:predicted Zn-dependent protease